MTTLGMGPVNDKPRVLGNRYEVGDLLGRGGMAEVHLGRDTRLGRVVAIKLLRTDLARDATFQARFRREAQSAAALNHPAIVAVYDTGEEQVVEAGGGVVSLPYIVMEYVEGRTLRELMGDTQQPLDVDTALDVTARVLSALEYSHRAGIVHRDIKPANVMLTPNGDVKVMDFGIARAMADASSTMTQTQAVIGTAQYLSPEQARGETVDARSDLYSAGCLLYELLTGRPPFVADSPVAVAYQHVREEPQPPSAFNPAVPADVDRIVLHSLAKDRETRYQTAADFRTDIEAYLAGRPVPMYAQGAGAATTQFLGAAGAGTRTMQPLAEPYPPGPVPVGGGMLPGAPPDDDYGYGRRQPEPQRGRGLSYALLALGIFVVAGLVVFTVMKLGSSGTEAPTTGAIPQVKGLTQQDAQNQLKAKNFTNVVVKTTETTTTDAGTVLDVSPAENSIVPLTQQVTLTVAKAPGQVALPDLHGKDVNEANQIIQSLGLKVGNVTRKDDTKLKTDQVISSDPPAGPVNKGQTVDMVVASGTVKLPNLVGKPYTDAVNTLGSLGLTAGPAVQQPDPKGSAAGTVLSQSLPPGAVPVGSTVTLTVSSGPTPSPTPTSTPPTSSPSASTPAPSDSTAPGAT
jgi:beta-lactam-binding protein with PASTA domain/predicted Ser/Thr protein kinase